MEPLIAQFLGYFFGIDLFPSIITLLGVIMIFGGTLLVNKGTKIMIRDNKRNVTEPQDGSQVLEDNDAEKLRELEAKVT